MGNEAGLMEEQLLASSLASSPHTAFTVVLTLLRLFYSEDSF